MNRTILATAGALGFGIALAGCGSSATTSTSDFKKQYAPVDAQYKKLGNELGAAITQASNKTDAQLATQLDSLSIRIGAANKKAASIKPPSKVKDDYGLLTRQLAQVESDLTALTAAVRSHDATSSKTDTEKLVTDAGVIKPTENRVRQAVGLPTD